tara:strand:+ start:1373 stop:1927 length:555 start_codon:yes stop_codon:yes gene_type:complete
MSKIIKKIENIKLMQTNFFPDNRGVFFEIFNQQKFRKINLKKKFAQNSISISKKNVVRGLHFTIKNPQAQLVTILEGKIFDCLVDLRPKSKNFLKHYSFILTQNKNNQLYMPPGYAHGFCVLSDRAILHYAATKIYDPKNSSGLIWNDQTVRIKWPIKKPIISNRDKNFKNINELIQYNELPQT